MAKQHVAEKFSGFGGSITDLVDHFSKPSRKKKKVALRSID